MKKFRLEEMVRGWFVGNFKPTAHSTESCEVAVKRYRKGESEAWHYHKVATEITIILDGEVEMNGQRHLAGDIVVLEPYEGTDFRPLSDVTTVVVKVPGAPDDKYLRGE
jgi:hypothetical protein